MQHGEPELLPATYILPLRWTDDDGLDELVTYLEGLTSLVQVIVVDGSPEPLFSAHAARFPADVRHVAPTPRKGLNGKVTGVMTGIHLAQTELLVLADDDVRYGEPELRRLLDLLGQADVVRPQNYFPSLPWHARWDTARTLLNRAFTADYAGTMGVRRSALLATDGYDGDVLFENLELIRTVQAAGGHDLQARDLFVGRIPPTAHHFLGQRVRQSYDKFAQPGRLALELCLLPLLMAAGSHWRRGHPKLILGILAGSCALAEVGRSRDGARRVYPWTSSFWAPVWVLERSVCVWFAVVRRLTGGVPYAGHKLRVAAHSQAYLRSIHAGRICR